MPPPFGHPRSILEILPVELLSEIKSHISHGDLFTLVCFYKTCTRFAQLFGPAETQAQFWESACLLAGLGCLPGEEPDEVDWKDVAFDCIERDGFCENPECGRALLEWNEADKMADTTSLTWAPTWDTFDDWAAMIDSPTWTNQTIQEIAFSNTSSLLDPIDAKEDAYFRQYNDIHDETEEPDKDSKDYLWDHPIACRSFAIFPPTRSMSIMTLVGTKTVKNENGVTVWDEICSIQEVLDTYPGLDDLSDLFRLLEYDLPLVFGEGCSLSEFLSRIRKYRGLLQFFGISEIEMEEWEDHDSGPLLSLGYKPVKRLKPRKRLLHRIRSSENGQRKDEAIQTEA
ncbi:hypothetical protein NLI96_g3361 [Meripilus lineatus]|uniref:F-box domain-containing protein n=1 Tax=Meripilus lineatus TaxID=2056292 RepID=A0AAD5VBN7_9APHY|nr:hypothetical protein NLI96_g3361 [Physisporinus lineatus]